MFYFALGNFRTEVGWKSHRVHYFGTKVYTPSNTLDSGHLIWDLLLLFKRLESWQGLTFEPSSFFSCGTHRGRNFDLSRSRLCRARESDTAINFMTNGSDYILAGHLWLIYGITGAQEAEASRQFSRERTSNSLSIGTSKVNWLGKAKITQTVIIAGF